MSIPILIRTYDEVRRLAIAGSVVAPGDFRLKKLVPELEQVGRKAPLFAKVAEVVSRLIASDDRNSAPALLEVTALLSAILYTQGETGIDGELAPLKTIELGLSRTQISARALKPLREALTTTGPGRLETVKGAFERGAFHDFRLIAPALAALDDGYPEIGDFVAQQILPFYGPAIFPELEATFDPTGRAGHARRLLLMHRLDRQRARPHIQRSLEVGSKEVRVAAIGCLGDSPDDLPFLLEQVRAKAKEVRTAALRALGKSGSDAAARVLCDAIATADLALAVEPLRTSRNPVVTGSLLEAAKNQFDGLCAGKESDGNKLGAQNERMRLLLDCLERREDKTTETLLLSMFGRGGQLGMVKGEPSGKDVLEQLVGVMSVGPPSLQRALVDAHATLPADCLGHALVAACRSRKPGEVFALFGPYLAAKINEKKKDRDPAHAKRQAIIDLLLRGPSSLSRQDDHDELELTANLDPKWLDLAVDLDRPDLVQALAVPGHAKASAYLAKVFQLRLGKSGDEYELTRVVDAMIKSGHPQATDAVIELLERMAKAKSAYNYEYLGRLIARLPRAEALPKLEAILPTLPDKMVDLFLEFMAEMK
jgi:HEAT repeats